MNISELRSAIETGHKACSVLREVLRELSKLHCQQSSGSYGPDTFIECFKCSICYSKEFIRNEEI